MNYRFVDRVLALEAGHRILTQKDVPTTEDYFDDLFPRFSRFPHSLMIESLASSSALLILATMNFRMLAMLLMVNEAIFNKRVLPGDRMVIDVRLQSLREAAAQFFGTIHVEGEEIANSTFALALFRLDKIADEKIRASFATLLQRSAHFLEQQEPVKERL